MSTEESRVRKRFYLEIDPLQYVRERKEGDKMRKIGRGKMGQEVVK